ncbi:sorting nexin-22-like isoform X2 [Clytia hemisphaerica]|uniref:sorting nexin-22-like isoform X2 n=1 Tax=Clytia hemisphaerica TaxID=252671 RepID=UPI0034D4F2BE
MFNNKIRLLIPNHRTIIENNKSFTVYCVEVVCDGKVTNVEHRYSEFYELYRKLSKMIAGKIVFPPKRLLNNKDVKLIEARRKGLQQYLQTVLYTFQDNVPPRLLDFLGIPDYYDQQYDNNFTTDELNSSLDGDQNGHDNTFSATQNMICFHLEEENTLPDIINKGCLEGIYG